MKRTFQHRVTVFGVAWVLLLAALALFFFWQRTGAMAMVAFVVLCVDVWVVDRLIHTSYVFEDDSTLVVSNGRFSKPIVIPLCDVWRAEERHVFFGLVHYVLIEYGAHHMVSVQTDDDEAFLKEMAKRLDLLR